MRGTVQGPFWVEQYRRDPQLRAELRYCAPAGIPHSTFLEWDADDRDKALAWLAVDDDKCPGCSNPLSESTSFENRTDWQVEVVTCHACKHRAAKSDQQGDGDYLVVTPRSDNG